VVLPYYLFLVEKRVCLSRDVYLIGAVWRAATRIEAGLGDLVQRTEMVKHKLGTQWPDDRGVR
jgi:hypothetical protein